MPGAGCSRPSPCRRCCSSSARCSVPESPRWLVKNGKAGRAATCCAASAADICRQRSRATSSDRWPPERSQRYDSRDLLEPRMFKILLLGVFLAVLQQWSGINVIFNYAEEVYREAGYGVSDMMFNIVLTGAINLRGHHHRHRHGRPFRPPEPDAHRLCGHRRFAPSAGLRRTRSAFKGLLRAGHSRSAPSACYGMSLAPIIWVLISEIFPNRIRGAAVSVAVSALVDRLLHPHLHVPHAQGERSAWPDLLDLWRHSASWDSSSCFLRVPETKAKARTDRTRTGRLAKTC